MLAALTLAAGGEAPTAAHVATASADGGSDADRLIVRLAPGARAADAVAELGGGEVVREIAALDTVVVEVADGQAGAAGQRLAGRGDVVSVERDGTAEIAQVTPDDPLWADQWGLERIAAPQAWSTTTGSDDVTIAVLDTGVDGDHPDLDGAVDPGANFTAEGTRDDTRDDHGHGTMTAGAAAARADNAAGLAGTCWTCRILPVKVMGAGGAGSLSDIAAGMVWAVDEGADVLNLSLGSFDDVQLMRDAIAYATTRGVAVVAAAGNFSSSARVYPAAYDDVLGVAASDRDDARESFSSFGDWTELAAPGCNVTTTLDARYTEFCGTSSAAALASGTIALGVAHEPGATLGQRQQALTATAVDADYVEFGRVDADATLTRLAEIAEPEPGPPPAPRPDVDDGDEEFETDPGLSLRRVAGADRFDTAARLSAGAFSPGVDRVYLATGLAFPDALAAGAAAGAREAPVLLTAPDGLPGATRDELARLDPAEVIVAGGAGAVSTATANAAGDAADAPVARVAGGDRFATAARLATEAFGDSADTVFVATGSAFPDALAGVPAAAARHAPVLLVTRDTLPAPTRDALAALSPDRVEILGGSGAVGPEVASALASLAGDGGVRRHGGVGRFETAAQVSEAFFGGGVDAAHLATGADFPDALAGGPAAAAAGGPLLLVTRDELPAATATELSRLRPRANVVLGGRAAVSDEVEAAASEASAADG